VKLLGKSIQDCQYIACMNPTAGSFTINPRLQRHFVSFAVGFPGPTSLLTIYETFLMGHLQNGPKPFSEEVCEIGKHIIQGALELHQGVGQVRGEREEREADRGEKRGEKRGERRREKKREERRERRRPCHCTVCYVPPCAVCWVLILTQTSFSSSCSSSPSSSRSSSSKNFRKSAVNFHYEFNIRHLSNVFQGMLVARPEQFDEPGKFVLLWLHESERVYGDRLVSNADLKKYNQLALAIGKKKFGAYAAAISSYFSDTPDQLIFCHYTKNIQDKM
jgi:hypothetical protein